MSRTVARPALRRAGVSRARQPAARTLWPLAVALTATLSAALFLRSFGTQSVVANRTQPGTWQVLDDGGAIQLNSPVGLAEDQLHNLYVVDSATYHVYKLSPRGAPLATFGSHGTAPGQFDHPSAIALDVIGNMYVADTANSRIQKLSATGVFLEAWGRPGSAPGEFNSPRGVAVDYEGNVYVADTGNDRIQKLSPIGHVMAV